MATIPASQIVNINANVLAPGGELVDLSGLFITQNSLFPDGQVVSFATAEDVALVAGVSSDEYKAAVKYFTAYSISTKKPGRILFYKINLAPTHAVLRSSPLAMTLTELQGITEVISITVDGVVNASTLVTLATATSFADAAAMIEAGFSYSAPNFTVTYDALFDQFVFTSNSTGTSSTIDFAIGSGADFLKLTAGTGATVTQGSNGVSTNDMVSVMNDVVLTNRNWFTFSTIFEPTLAQKKSFVQWVSPKNAEYAYICWDTDVTSNTVNPVADNIYNYVNAGNYDNVFLVSRESSSLANLLNLAAFVSGSAASIDFTATNNRITYAFKEQAGLDVSISNPSIALNVITNGSNFYGDYGTKNDEFKFLYPGQVSGKWQWFDELTNAAYMKATMQNTLLTLLMAVPSIPYNSQGYNGLIKTSLLGDISSFINFGAIRNGITLSGVQKAAINASAGRDITGDLFHQGFVLDVLDPGAIVRAQRGSPIINLYYTSGGAVHTINMTTTLVL